MRLNLKERVGAMNSSHNDKRRPEGRDRRRSLGQRLLVRFGTPAILTTVLLVVVAWTGFLGWILVGLLGRLIQ